MLDEETVAEGEAVTEVDEVPLGGDELTGADGAAEDNNGEEEAEDGKLEIAESSLDSSQPRRSQAVSDHLHYPGRLGGAESEKWRWRPREEKSSVTKRKRWKGEKAMVLVLVLVLCV